MGTDRGRCQPLDDGVACLPAGARLGDEDRAAIEAFRAFLRGEITMAELHEHTRS